MADSSWHLTPSGSTVALTTLHVDRHPHRQMNRHWFQITTSASSSTLYVGFDSSPTLGTALSQQLGMSFSEIAPQLAQLAVLRQVDQQLPTDRDGVPFVELGFDDAIAAWNPPKSPDRDVRRFLARRVYDFYSRGLLNDPIVIPHLDLRLLGITFTDLLRNAQLLAAEGYWHIASSGSAGLSLIPQARLVREVERYGAPKEDAVASRDYIAAVRAYSQLSEHLSTIQLEYDRYSVAATDTELSSVFKAIAPVVEAVSKGLVAAHGSKQSHSTLGPVIADLRARQIGAVSLWSQLDHIVKFGRDLAQHGAALPGSVLRIACETCFELLPQLGSLFPLSGTAVA